MATIDQLCTSILDMPEDEVYTLIRNLRQARRTKPEAPRTHKKAVKGTRAATAEIKGSGSKVSLDVLTKTLTPEQREKLLKELGVSL